MGERRLKKTFVIRGVGLEGSRLETYEMAAAVILESGVVGEEYRIDLMYEVVD